MSRIAVSRPLSETAMPADSWPRCWSAKSPKYASRATSRSGAWMPRMPHMARRPPCVGRGADRSSGDARGSSRRRHAESPQRHAVELRDVLGPAGDDRPAAALAEPRRPRPRRSRRSAPSPDQIASSASATARPPSEASCALVRTGAAVARNAMSAASRGEVGPRRPAGGAAEEARLVLGAVERDVACARRAARRRPRSSARGSSRTSSTRPTQPTTGVGSIARPSVSL